jgi:FKBP-type peptidyl-prolyl cis-trans isomerase FklB
MSNSEMDKFSYSLGMNIAASLMNDGLDNVVIKDLALGLEDLLKNSDTRVSAEEAQQILQSGIQEAQSKKFGAVKEEGAAYLAENAKKDGVTVLESGLQYEVITAGTGNKPAATDNVTVHYKGTLIDGTVFDSSIERGQPATFPVNGVIPGWVEGLQLMTEGSKWKLHIPFNLAYGEQGAGGSIPPFATLVFEVELIKIG